MFTVTYIYRTWQTSIYDYEGWAHSGPTRYKETFGDRAEAVARASKLAKEHGSGYAHENIRIVDGEGNRVSW